MSTPTRSLTEFRDHCRRMAAAEHKPECPSLVLPEPIWEPIWVDDDGAHGLHMTGITVPSKCDGCNSAKDRALFARLAAEVDEYQAGDLVLFGDQP